MLSVFVYTLFKNCLNVSLAYTFATNNKRKNVTKKNNMIGGVVIYYMRRGTSILNKIYVFL